MALSFVSTGLGPANKRLKSEVPVDRDDEAVFARIEREQGARGSKVQEYHFDMKQVEAFRYRMEDALRSVTRSAVREARVGQLKTEILNSDKLKVDGSLTVDLRLSSCLLSRRRTSRTTRWTSNSCGTTSRCTRRGCSRT
jgi:anti-sigma28 factor (negative regulator of flagellin synthesis)